MSESIIEQRLAEYKAYQAFMAACRDRIRYDHLYLYDAIKHAKAFPAKCQEIIDGR